MSRFFSATNFSTGKLSPVSEPWITNRSLAWTTRTSPGIMSPAVSWTTSPGTRCETAISWAAPSRSTVAFTEIIALSFAAALLALASWISRRPTLSAIMSSIIVAARASPVANDTAASTASRITSGLRTARQTRVRIPGRWSLARTFCPCSREPRLGLVGGQAFGARLQARRRPRPRRARRSRRASATRASTASRDSSRGASWEECQPDGELRACAAEPKQFCGRALWDCLGAKLCNRAGR